MHTNLLPTEYLQKKALRRQSLIAVALVVTMIVAVTGVYGLHYARVSELKTQLAENYRKHPGIQQTFEEMRLWEQQLANAKAESDAYQQRRDDKRMFVLVGLIAKNAQQTAGKIRLNHLNIRIPSNYLSESTAAATPMNPTAIPTDGTRHGSISMDGLADNSDTISRFVASLRGLGVLSQVTLKGSTETSVAAERCRQFQIECEL